jgi:cholesterol oxidase
MTILKRVYFMDSKKFDYDYIIIGSGFGGSVAALRLSEKGYRVLVLEKGKWFQSSDFPKTNWNLKRWLWVPALRFFGFFKVTYFRHISILSGVGVGGGSLMYANTLLGDLALQKLSSELGKEDLFQPTNVAVYFGEPDKTVPDPYFNGEGPERTGCNFCGGCMIGCQYNAKNTLDKNYLYLAQKKGAEIKSESEVYDVRPLNDQHGEDGYRIYWRKATSLFKKRGSFTCRGIVFSGGVLGSVSLLLKLRESSLPLLSNRIGHFIRTNSESLSGITVYDKQTVFSDGIAIGSILQIDEYSHVEPVRYPAGSGAWRLLMAPMAHGRNIFIRIGLFLWDWLSQPIKNLKIYFVDDWAKRTQILLFMQTINTTLRFSKGLFRMKSGIASGETLPAFIPEAKDLAEKYAKIVNGKPTTLLTEMILSIPLTAHILGGAVMGESGEEGVIDKYNRVFGYKNMYVCDGSMISANPGVNPSLTITAISERAMSRIQNKEIPPNLND